MVPAQACPEFVAPLVLPRLRAMTPRIRDLADRADTTHVLFNNCYSNYAQVNARQLADELGR